MSRFYTKEKKSEFERFTFHMKGKFKKHYFFTPNYVLFRALDETGTQMNTDENKTGVMASATTNKDGDMP